ncbi:MAG: putative transporter integral rane protein [Frankiales bacterium]|nr:putative transporter integral rane protein [Frankiales bacterium]
MSRQSNDLSARRGGAVAGAFRSELVKLGRRSTLYTAGAVLPLLALLATTLLFVNAGTVATTGPDARFAPTLGVLAQPGGLTAGFNGANGFLGILVFVLFLTSFSSEYSQGTLRTLLVREPRRGRLMLGKLAAIVLLVAASLLAAEVVSGGLSLVLASVRDVPTSHWFTGTGVQQALADYANALVAATFFGVLGAALGVLVRSTAVGLAIGLAWLMPLEHIIENAWADAAKWFPGLLFDAVSAGGTQVTSYDRALLMGGAFAVLALAVGAVSFVRRDVSG